MSQAGTITKTQINVGLTEPPMFKIIYLNDNATPMEFVILILKEVFKHTTESANDVMLQVHETGSGIAGIYSFEIAEAKAVESTNLARANGFPLQIKLEEE
jgi:ATP-dependent Clp protease adaptor protein ClpS